MKKLVFPLILALTVSLSACAAPEPAAEPVAIDYQLQAGEPLELSEMAFTEEVVVTVDPASTAENRSEINFLSCSFEKGLKIIGDGSAFVRLIGDCSIQVGYGVTAMEATPGSAQAATIDDDFVKLYLEVDNINVTTSTILTTICTAEGFTLNGNTYRLADYPGFNTYMAAFFYENGEEVYIEDAWTE